MNYTEYRKMIESTFETEGLKYAPVERWLHSEHIPFGVISYNYVKKSVIRIPQTAINKYSKEVPVAAIGNNAFCGCKYVTDIILHSGITKICSGAFSGCVSLERITIPKAVREIKAYTFSGCTSLKDIYYEGSQDDWKKINIEHTHEVVLGEIIPGTPVQSVKEEQFAYLPGNEALFAVTIHFYCDLDNRIPVNLEAKLKHSAC